MTALIEAKVDPEKAEKALTSIENAISSRIEVAKMESYTEKIVPVEMETSGIRAEIHTLAEGIKLGFDSVNLRFEKMHEEMNLRFKQMHEEMNLRFEKMDQKMDFIREGLEKRIDATEKMIIFTRENLELQIRSVEKHLAFQQKLLWGILGVVIATLFKKYLGLE
ncbi:MAG: hypothetical protein H7A24_09855 [Leptospiraceae bacterium]|nr:hypothetical protein [Leptospiraceae bacterium]